MAAQAFRRTPSLRKEMSLGLTIWRWFLMSLGVGLEQELGDEFEGDVDEFDEIGCVFVVCLLHFGMCLMSLGVRLMSLGVGLKRELGGEFGVDFDEFDEFGGAFVVCLLRLEMRLLRPSFFFPSFHFCRPPFPPSFRRSLPPSFPPSVPHPLRPSLRPSLHPSFPPCLPL